MKRNISRLRMFAGPNGSGKSTLKSNLPEELLGVYINPDELESNIREQGFLSFADYHVQTTERDLRNYFANSPFLTFPDFEHFVSRLSISDGYLSFENAKMDSYIASALADFLRQKLLDNRTSFTFETVMSHRSKIDLLRQARELGYRTYLYFVATEDKSINISRVRSRVKMGGHGVPEDKIEERYHRSLDLLVDAILQTNRAYIFDNSGENKDGKHTWVAEITDGEWIELKSNRIPAWFDRAVFRKIDSDQ